MLMGSSFRVQIFYVLRCLWLNNSHNAKKGRNFSLFFSAVHHIPAQTTYLRFWWIIFVTFYLNFCLLVVYMRRHTKKSWEKKVIFNSLNNREFWMYARPLLLFAAAFLIIFQIIYFSVWKIAPRLCVVVVIIIDWCRFVVAAVFSLYYCCERKDDIVVMQACERVFFCWICSRFFCSCTHICN